MKKRRDTLPREFWQHLTPLEIDVLMDEAPAYTFMTASQLEDERKAIAEALEPLGPVGQTAPPTPDEACYLAVRFVELLPFSQPPHADVLREVLRARPAPLSTTETLALSRRLSQIRAAIRHASLYQGRDFDPTDTFAVVPQWQLRWQSLISGALFPAYVALLPIDNMV